MRKNRNLAIAALIVLISIAVAYALYDRIYLPRKYSALTEKIITGAIAALDEDRLAGQPIHIAVPGTELTEETRKAIAAIKPGGIIFFGFNLQDAAQIKKLTTDLQALAAELGLPPFLISTDQEGGYVRRVREGVLQTPPAMDMGATGDRELCRATGYHVSRDLGALGINVFFAPIVDINNNPQNPVIGLRSFGANLDAVLGCALPFEQGARQAMREGGALPVIKHFPGHGDTQTDSHWALPVIDKKIDELRALELIPFREAIRDGAQAVMTAHILYPQIDPDHPATLSSRWLSGTLRSELGFAGLVFTDAMEMNAVSQNFKTLDRPVTAILAGADVLLYTSWQEEPPEAHARLQAAIQSGTLKTGRNAESQPLPLQRALENQLRQKLALLDIGKYLTPEEAAWYRKYTQALQAQKPATPVTLSKDDLTARFAQIRWSTKKKKGGPIWLAGQKNSAKAR
ncbi:MAG TPA: beta-N-acetylhexosaminidase [Turneriella sp.]|nr:beta-N-acetylhexosaminidase [Turneriella sp.]HNE20307.1 beta-N-acetylhexosaminidase [Turneriella sp.]HNL10445.1 beta-N-acetylhexosaminidase [Turneriella sp.]HNL54885.1 beta-N-acetylhexosaminidase [Turneriella sp.]HNN00561.1 beta-N-acetylhexosaminidase [Turneriella sp.]